MKLQKMRRPPSGERGGRRGSTIDDDGPDDTARASKAPGLLVRLSDPPKIFILATDLAQQREAERIAELVLELLEKAAA